MYFIKNAVTNIVRYKGRFIINSILLLLVMVVSAYAFLVCIACSVASDDIKKSLDNRYTFSSYYNDAVDIVVYKEDIFNFADSEYVDKAVLSFKSWIFLRGEKSTENMSVDEMNETYRRSTLMVEGWSSSELSDIDDFSMNVVELIEGRMFKEYGEVVISDQLAKFRSWEIGDKIPTDSSPSEEGELTIVGIYKIKRNIYSFDLGAIVRNFDPEIIGNDFSNVIYSSFDTAYDIFVTHFTHEEEKEDGTTEIVEGHIRPYLRSNYYPIFYINDADETKLKLFTEELHEKGIPENTEIMRDRTTMEAVTLMLDVFESSLLVVFLILMFIGIVITFFATLISLNERKYEFAVLSSMGMSKPKMCLSVCIENFVYILCITLIGVFVARIFTVPVTNMINPELLAWFDVKVAFDPIFVSFFAIYTVGLSMLASLLFMIYIISFSPMKLFMKRI